MSKVRILSPRPEINENTAVDAVFLFILVELWIQMTKSFCRVRILPSVWCEIHQTCGAFVTICLRLILGKFTHCRPDQKYLYGAVFVVFSGKPMKTALFLSNFDTTFTSNDLAPTYTRNLCLCNGVFYFRCMVNGKRYLWSLHTSDPDLARFLVRQILDAEFNAGVPKQNMLAWALANWAVNVPSFIYFFRLYRLYMLYRKSLILRQHSSVL